MTSSVARFALVAILAEVVMERAIATRRCVRAHRCGLVWRAAADLPSYSDRSGAVLNATIDRYAFASIQPRGDCCLVFDACDVGQEETHRASPAVPKSRLLLHRGVYERMVREYNDNQPLAITVTTVVDAPMGSGLGSSSALVVALIEAYCAYLDVPLGRYEVAHLAHQIERVDLGLAGGQQDQFSAAFGGINFIEFLQGGRVIVNPLRFGQRY